MELPNLRHGKTSVIDTHNMLTVMSMINTLNVDGRHECNNIVVVRQTSAVHSSPNKLHELVAYT